MKRLWEERLEEQLNRPDAQTARAIVEDLLEHYEEHRLEDDSTQDWYVGITGQQPTERRRQHKRTYPRLRDFAAFEVSDDAEADHIVRAIESVLLHCEWFDGGTRGGLDAPPYYVYLFRKSKR